MQPPARSSCEKRHERRPEAGARIEVRAYRPVRRRAWARGEFLWPIRRSLWKSGEPRRKAKDAMGRSCPLTTTVGASAGGSLEATGGRIVGHTAGPSSTNSVKLQRELCQGFLLVARRVTRRSSAPLSRILDGWRKRLLNRRRRGRNRGGNLVVQARRGPMEAK